MLTLDKDSACDVCANEYGPFNLPRCIPCGHVLCEACVSSIVSMSSSKPQPVCPFCRVPFTLDGVRIIRIDFSQSSGGGSSGPSSSSHLTHGGGGLAQSCLPPLGMDPTSSGAILDDETVLYEVRSRSRSAVTSARPSRATSRERDGGVFKALDEDKPSHLDGTRHHDRALELEKKIAKVATKRCSVEEVQALQKELADWMSADKALYAGGDIQRYTAIQLSNLLLRAIIMNHVAHSEAARVARGAESTLRACLADGDLIRQNLVDENRKLKKENQKLKIETKDLHQRLKALDPDNHSGLGAVTPVRRQSLSAPTSPDGSYYTSFSSASTAVPLHYSSSSSNAYSSRDRERDSKKESFSNPTSLANSPCSSGRTTPTAGLTLSAPTAFGIAAVDLHARATTTGTTTNTMGGVSSGTTTPGRSSASAAAAALPLHPTTHPSHVHSQPATPSPTTVRYTHTRAASMVSRAQSVAPTREREREREREKRSMTPAPPAVHQRSASVAPGALGPSGTVRGVIGGGMLGRSMTPGPTSSASSAYASANANKEGNGYSAGVGLGAGASGGSIPPLPSFGSSSSSSSNASGYYRDLNGGSSRPPVPPKPRTLSQSQGPGQGSSLFSSSTSTSASSSAAAAAAATATTTASAASPMKVGTGYSSSSGAARGVIDDRDGEREKEKKTSRGKYERWMPSALQGIVRPATSQS